MIVLILGAGKNLFLYLLIYSGRDDEQWEKYEGWGMKPLVLYSWCPSLAT